MSWYLLLYVVLTQAQFQEEILPCLQDNLQGVPSSKIALMQHIRSKMHKESIRKSPFNQHILDLADKYHKKQRVHREARRRDKLEMVAKTADQESNEAVFIDREGKMEKRDESLTVAPTFIHFNSQIHRELVHPFHITSYQHEQQLLAYHTAFYRNLFLNSTRNMTNYSFSPSVTDYISTTQGKAKKSLTYIIIDE